MEKMFSVVVPIYKVEKYLHKCIQSILSQTFLDFELLLVDDGSPDECPKICDYYSENDERVRVIHKENEGLVAARNTGIKEAKGNYICYVDGDDWISNDLLYVVNEKILGNPDIDMVVYQGVKQFKTKQERLPDGPKEGLYDKKRLEKEVYPYMMYDSRQAFCNGLIFPVAWNKVYKREFLLKHYCKEEKIRMGEDNAFVFECLYYANKVYFCNEILYFYNQSNLGSMVHSYDANRFDNNKLLVEYIESNLAGKEKVIDEQINAFKAYWLIMAVFHEVKSGRDINVSRKHIKNKLQQLNVLNGIHLSGIPKSAVFFLLLLKYRLYILALIGAKVISLKRDKINE